MPFVDYLKGNQPETRTLEVAFGVHVVEGDLAKAISTGASPTHIVTVQHMLGDTLGRGWKGIIGLWFRGFTERDPADFKFHPGKQTPDPVYVPFTATASTDVIAAAGHTLVNGDMAIFTPGCPAPLVAGKIYYARDVVANVSLKVSMTSGGAAVNITADGPGKLYRNDPDLGIDPVFDQDTPHSNVAWIRAKLPNGSEVGIPEADIKANPPVGLSAIVECQLGDIHDDEGNVVTPDVLITNPADVIAFGCKEIRKFPDSRIDWASLDVLRQKCEAEVMPDYTALLTQGVGLTARYFEGNTFATPHSKRIDPVIQYDLSTGAPAYDLTPTSFSVRFEGKIRFKYSENYTIYLTHNDSGKCWIADLVTPIIDNASSGTDSATFAATADEFEDIKLEWANAASDSQFMLEWSSPSQPRQVIPQDRLYPKNEAQKRFQTHIAFTARTTFEDFLNACLWTCNGDYQDVDGKLVFFNIDDLEPSFVFDSSNINNQTFKYRPRFSQQEIMELPNRFIAVGRDLENRYLAPFDPPLYYDLPELQEEAGRIIEETVVVGNSTRFQTLRNLEHHAKLRTAPMLAEFEGMPQTFPVLPGDIVTVEHEKVGAGPKEFICAEATDQSVDKDRDNRLFTLYLWDEPEAESSSSSSSSSSPAESSSSSSSSSSPAESSSSSSSSLPAESSSSSSPVESSSSSSSPAPAGPPFGLFFITDPWLSGTFGMMWSNDGGLGDNVIYRSGNSGSTWDEAGRVAYFETTFTDWPGQGCWMYKVENDAVEGESNSIDACYFV